jgi:hypothetical protein
MECFVERDHFTDAGQQRNVILVAGGKQCSR